jgi:hypothetical protein
MTLADYRAIGTKRCLACGRMLPDVDGAPNICPEHPVEPVRREGSLTTMGYETIYEAESITRVGLFAAVVGRYVKRSRPIIGVEQFETWYDPETGRKMGRNVGPRRLP